MSCCAQLIYWLKQNKYAGRSEKSLVSLQQLIDEAAALLQKSCEEHEFFTPQIRQLSENQVQTQARASATLHANQNLTNDTNTLLAELRLA